MKFKVGLGSNRFGATPISQTTQEVKDKNIGAEEKASGTVHRQHVANMWLKPV